MQANSAKVRAVPLPKVQAEVPNMAITFGRARMLLRGVKVRALAQKLGWSEDRLHKILYATKGYPPEESEREALARELALFKGVVLNDATRVLEEALTDASERAATVAAMDSNPGLSLAVPELDVRESFPADAIEIAFIPLIGRIAAGRPVLARENIEGLIPAHLPDEVLKPGGKFFALIVRGDSMEGCGLDDGDTVICRVETEPKPGKVVAATLVVTRETTLKFLVVRDGKGFLVAQPARAPERYPDIEIKGGVEIHGTVVAFQKGAPRFVSPLPVVVAPTARKKPPKK
jgi:SOS-response transcriptional repressor LexA